MKNKNRGIAGAPSRLEMIELIKSHTASACGGARVLPVAGRILIEILHDEEEKANDWSCFDDKELTDTVLRFICAYRIPIESAAYFNLVTDCASYLNYYSKSDLSESGEIVRVPRAVNGLKVAEKLRAEGDKVYIVESVYELRLWVWSWGGEALIAKNLIQYLDEVLEVFAAAK